MLLPDAPPWKVIFYFPEGAHSEHTSAVSAGANSPAPPERSAVKTEARPQLSA